jgi:hypothetical protein
MGLEGLYHFLERKRLHGKSSFGKFWHHGLIPNPKAHKLESEKLMTKMS